MDTVAQNTKEPMQTMKFLLLLVSALSISACTPTTASKRTTTPNQEATPAVPQATPLETSPKQSIVVAPAEPQSSTQRISSIWVTQSSALPFQVMYVYQSINSAGRNVFCATLDAQALGAWPIEISPDGQAFTLWLRPRTDDGPPNHFQGASCPKAFPSTSLSDGVLPTSAPSRLTFTLGDGALHTTVRGGNIAFTAVNGVDLRLFMSMANGDHHSPHAPVAGFLEGASVITNKGRLKVTMSKGGISIVKGTVASLLKVMAENPKSTFELDSPMELDQED